MTFRPLCLLAILMVTLVGCGGASTSSLNPESTELLPLIGTVPVTTLNPELPGSSNSTGTLPPEALPTYSYPADFPISIESVILGGGVEVTGLDPLSSYTFITDTGHSISAQNLLAEGSSMVCFEALPQCTGTVINGTVAVIVLGADGDGTLSGSPAFNIDIQPSDVPPVYYEGTVLSPVAVTVGSQTGRVGATRFADDFSYYQAQGLTIGHRYELRITSLDDEFSDTELIVTSGDGGALCDPNHSGETTCQFVATEAVVPVQVAGVQAIFGEVNNIALTELSPASEFEGSWLQPVAIRLMDAEPAHHLGTVDEYDSYYDITGLEAGQRYTVKLHSRVNLARLSSLHLDSGEKIGGICLFENPWDNEGDLCTFTASSSRQRLSISGSSSHTTAQYILRIERDPASQGTVITPIQVPFGRVIDATVSATTSSYYELRDLPVGSPVLLSYQLLDGQRGTYSLSNSAGVIPCVGTDGCEFVADSSTALLTVTPNQDSIRSTRFVVAAMPLPENTTDIIAGSTLPAAVQVRDYFSRYTVSGLIPRASYWVSLDKVSSRVSINVLGNGVIQCGSVNKVIPAEGCYGVSDDNGELTVRIGGSSPGASAMLSIEQREALPGDYVSPARQTVVPDNSPTGISRSILVSDSGISTVERIRVSVDVTHEFTSDISLSLVAPDGRTVVLFDHLAGGSFIATVFDDYAPAPIAKNQSRIRREFRPQFPLHVLNGMAADGLWRLMVIDDRASNISTGSGGVLTSWGISFSEE